MKKVTRLGVSLLVIGVALLLVTVFRGRSPSYSESGMHLPPLSWRIHVQELWAPRSLMMEVVSQLEVDIYILDEAGISAWEQEEKLSPLFTFNQTSHDIYTVQLNRRGGYAFLFHNPSNSYVEVSMNLIFYGFETDLLVASIALTASGAIMIVAQRFLPNILTAKQSLQ